MTRILPSITRRVLPFKALLAVLAGAFLSDVGAAAPTLRALVESRGSIVAGDVTINNFRTPLEWPIRYVDSPLVTDRGDRLSVTASQRADGSVDLVFTSIDPLTGLPAPQVSTRALGNDFTSFVTYDVVVTNPSRALHAVAAAYGPATSGYVYNSGYAYTGPASGSLFGMPVYETYLPPTVLPPALLPLIPASFATPQVSADFRGARLGHRWGLVPFSFGFGSIGTTDSLTVSLYLADALAPPAGATPRVETFHPDSVFLTSPAGPGGATVSLSSASQLLGAATQLTVLTVPASITVPEGSTYATWPVVGNNPSLLFSALATVTGTLGADTVQAYYQVFPNVYPPAAPVQPTLNIVKGGTGKGTVVSNNGLSCGSKCSVVIGAGANISFAAQPGSGSVFSSWGNACTGNQPATCTVLTVGADQFVVANFDAVAVGGGGGGGGGASFGLSIGRSNSGTVTSDVGGINCGNTCAAKFAQSTAVSLTATPIAGKSFVGWGGACSGTAPLCSLTVNGNLSVQANFSK